MNKYFLDEKKKLKNINAPDNMEDLLEFAIEDEYKNPNKTFKIASIIIVFILITCNSNNIASLFIDERNIIFEDYGEIIPKNILEIQNTYGFQKMDKNLVFKDNDIFKIEGVIIEKYGLNLFVEKSQSDYDLKIKNHNNKSLESVGIINKDNRECTIYHMEVQIKGDNIELEVFNRDKNETEVINLEIDRDKILLEEEKVKINKTFRYKGEKYIVKNMIITPLSIRISGFNENTMELVFRTLLNRRKDYNKVNFKLEINGEIIENKTISKTTDLSGKYFEVRFDEFERDIKDMKLVIFDYENNKLDEIIIK